MTKFIILLLSLSFLFGCEINPVQQDSPLKGATENIQGLWSEDEHFVVIEGNHIKVHISPNFIDSGEFTYSNDIIECKNEYTNSTTSYKVVGLSDKQLALEVSYRDVDGFIKDTMLVLEKSNKTPEQLNFTGKTITQRGKYYGLIELEFKNEFSALLRNGKDMQPNPINLYYIYNEGYMYMQQFSFRNDRWGSSTWCDFVDTGEVVVFRLSFDNQGMINGFSIIKGNEL
ncbi:MAG: hypothetical protein J6V00_02265 [Bacteroidaceae bacterium]|nr:hypothetical protein [Bacteroidaceae bacterium]